jgi:hypothetical protein
MPLRCCVAYLDNFLCVYNCMHNCCTAQVGKKVADEGNRLARHVSMKRRYFRGEKVRERSSGGTAHDLGLRATSRVDELQVSEHLSRTLLMLLHFVRALHTLWSRCTTVNGRACIVDSGWGLEVVVQPCVRCAIALVLTLKLHLALLLC